MINKFDEFEENYKQAIESIKLFLKDEDPETRHLIQWLFITEHNPYGIFSNAADAAAMYSAETFAGVCHCIHHALVDDGEICFPVVNGEPHIAFLDKYMENFEEYVLSESDKIRMDTYNFACETYGFEKEKQVLEITFLKDVYEFTEAFDKHEAEHKLKCEKMDKEMAKWRAESDIT